MSSFLKSSSYSLDLKDSFIGVCQSSIGPCNELVKKMNGKKVSHNFALKNSMFLTSRLEFFLRWVQSRRTGILCSLKAHLYAKNDVRIRKISSHYWGQGNGGSTWDQWRISQLVLETNQIRQILMCESISVLTSFRVLLFFHASGIVSTALKQKKTEDWPALFEW